MQGREKKYLNFIKIKEFFPFIFKETFNKNKEDGLKIEKKEVKVTEQGQTLIKINYRKSSNFKASILRVGQEYHRYQVLFL